MPGQSKTLEDLFEENLKDIYYAERKILVALPKMAKATNSPELKAAFQKHLTETEGQVDRIQQIFKMIKKPAKGKTCPAILGLVEEADEVMEDFEDSAALDAGPATATLGGGAVRRPRAVGGRAAAPHGRDGRPRRGARRAARLTNFYGRLSRAVPPGLPHDTGALAAEIIGNIGNRAPTLATAVNGWGDRAALLALADPAVALTAIAWAGGHTNAPPPPGKDRLVWVGRNAEAREMVLFAVSDAYVEARDRLGLG